jgi:tetraether lipid synthase
MNPWKPLELALTGGARLLWPAFQAINQRVESTPFQPKWADRPLLKSKDRSKPQFGWPRTTDSLCPTCVREARARILAGDQAVESLVNEHVGEIKAHIVERDGRVVIEKTCPTHGTFTDTLAINPAFLKRLESRRGSDDRSHQPLQHDVRPVLHGRQPGRLRPRAHPRRREEAAR